MTTRIGSAVRNTLVVAAGASALVLGGAGLASASDPSDMPHVPENEKCIVFYDEDGWMECEPTPFGLAVTKESTPKNS